MSIIKGVHHRNISQIFMNPTAFCFKKDKKHKWLQKLCIKILSKLGCHLEYEVMELQTIQIDTDDLIEAIRKQIDSAYLSCGKMPTKAFIGANTFAQLMNQPEMQDLHWSFGAEYWRDRSIFGLEVTIIPWMEGVLVV